MLHKDGLFYWADSDEWEPQGPGVRRCNVDCSEEGLVARR